MIYYLQQIMFSFICKAKNLYFVSDKCPQCYNQNDISRNFENIQKVKFIFLPKMYISKVTESYS